MLQKVLKFAIKLCRGGARLKNYAILLQLCQKLCSHNPLRPNVNHALTS